MQGMINTGSDAVDKMGEINLTGNVTPPIWYRTILRENGKPYLLAICMLSEICYWYRPTEIRDELTGQIIGFKKKFKGDLLQKDYRSLAEFFGESKATVKAAMDKLEGMGLIRRVWRDHKAGGRLITNILYIDLNVDRLYEVTFGTEAKRSIPNQSVDNPMEGEEETIEIEEDEALETLPQNFGGGGTKYQGTLPQNFMGGGTKYQGVLLQNFMGGGINNRGNLSQKIRGGGVEFSGTNTENTTEITSKKNKVRALTEITSDQIISDQKEKNISKPKSCKNKCMPRRVEEVRKEIRDRISFDVLEKDSRFYDGVVNELVEIMVEVYVAGKDVSISGAIIPYSLICERFDQYDQILMEYVLFSLKENKTKVGNMKKYLLATLFNAPITCENYYVSEAKRTV